MRTTLALIAAATVAVAAWRSLDRDLARALGSLNLDDDIAPQH